MKKGRLYYTTYINLEEYKLEEEYTERAITIYEIDNNLPTVLTTIVSSVSENTEEKIKEWLQTNIANSKFNLIEL